MKDTGIFCVIIIFLLGVKMGFDGTEKESRASPKCPEKGRGSSPALKGRKRLPFQLLMFSPHKNGETSSDSFAPREPRA